MNSDAPPAGTNPRQVSERQRAIEHMRAVAKPHRLRVQLDIEGFPVIPGRYGRIEWYCDGVNCWACALPGQLALAVYTERPRLFARLWAIPGVRRHQTGDTEMRAVFPPEAIEKVAALIRARHRRTQVAANSLRNLRPRATSSVPKASSGDGPAEDKGIGAAARRKSS